MNLRQCNFELSVHVNAHHECDDPSPSELVKLLLPKGMEGGAEELLFAGNLKPITMA